MRVYYYYSTTTSAERSARSQKRKEIADAEAARVAEDNRTVAQKVNQYLAAEFQHARKGRATRESIAARTTICLSCPGRVDELDGKKDEGGIGFCTKCSCPASKRSQLSVKLTIADVPCPIGRFGTAEAEGATLKSVGEALLGPLSVAAGVVRKALRAGDTDAGAAGPGA